MDDKNFRDPAGAGDQRIQERLKEAVRSVSTPPFLEARIRNGIAAHKPENPWLHPWVALAGALVICAGLTVAYQLGHFRFTTGSQDAYIASVSGRVAAVMRVGLRDHVHCAVFRKYPRNTPRVEDLVSAMAPPYQALVAVAKDRVPEGYTLWMAHQCGYQGRRFVHLAFRNQERLLSLVVAQKAAGESFQSEGLLPALSQAGIPLYTSGVQHFQIAGFESQGHLVYVISDLPQQRNMEVMMAVAPIVKDFLSNLEL